MDEDEDQIIMTWFVGVWFPGKTTTAIHPHYHQLFKKHHPLLAQSCDQLELTKTTVLYGTCHNYCSYTNPLIPIILQFICKVEIPCPIQTNTIHTKIHSSTDSKNVFKTQWRFWIWNSCVLSEFTRVYTISFTSKDHCGLIFHRNQEDMPMKPESTK